MKLLKILIVGLFTISSYSQQVWDMTYLHVPGPEIGKFAQLHKKITDMAQGEGRTIQDQWVFRHWYGSGHSIVIVDIFNSAEDAVNDDIWGALGSNYEKLSDEEKKEMDSTFEQWWGYFDGHTDELRYFDGEKHSALQENVNWDIPFVWVVGSYNTSGDYNEMIDAYMNWQTRPNVSSGIQLGGGATTHFKGSGSDVMFFAGFKDLTDFAKSASSQGTPESAEAGSKFWSMVNGDHSDQIYRFVGKMNDGKFDLAGPNN